MFFYAAYATIDAMDMYKKAKVKKLVLVSMILVISACLLIFLWFKKPVTAPNRQLPTYSSDVVAKLGDGTCDDAAIAAIEEQYQLSIKSNKFTAAQAQYDLAACAIYRNENETALKYYEESRRLFDSVNAKLEVERAQAGINFANQRIDAAKNTPTVVESEPAT